MDNNQKSTYTKNTSSKYVLNVTHQLIKSKTTQHNDKTKKIAKIF